MDWEESDRGLAETESGAVEVIELPGQHASRAAGPLLGYGPCSISGCPCPGFKDTYGSDLCNNCGHKYTDHY